MSETQKRGTARQSITIDLDLVRVHRGVSNQDLSVGDTLGLTNADRFVENETLSQEGITQRAADLLDHLNALQIGASLCQDETKAEQV